MRFVYNDKTDAVLERFYHTYEKTLDTEEFVSPKTNAFVRRFIDKSFRKALRGISKETRKKLKRFKTEAKQNGLTLDEYFDLIEEIAEQEANEDQKVAEISAENVQEKAKTTETVETPDAPEDPPKKKRQRRSKKPVETPETGEKKEENAQKNKKENGKTPVETGAPEHTE